MYKDLKDVREYYATLRELVTQHSGGWEDADSLAKVEGLCGAAIAALNDAECHERLIALEAVNTRLFFIETVRNRTLATEANEARPIGAG